MVNGTRESFSGGGAHKPCVVAIVPARGGSKGVPRKNIALVGGHPLIAWSIQAGLEAEHVDRVIVSTDDDEIAAIAQRCGAEVPFRRPAEYASDEATDLPVIRHAVEWLVGHERARPEILVQLRPTSPIRPRGLIDRSIDLLRGDPDADCVRAVSDPVTTPYKMWRPGGDGSLTPLLGDEFAEAYNMPRQKLPRVVRQTGHVDTIRVRTIEEKGSLTGTRVLPIEVPPWCCVDIDRAEDLRLAGWLLGGSGGGEEIVRPPRHRVLPRRIREIVLDFDGVLTDNSVAVSSDGTESVVCSRGDGLGVAMLREAGVPVRVLSSEINRVVSVRCEKLGIPCDRAVSDKGAALREFCASAGVRPDEIVYVGNDLNDLPAYEAGVFRVAVADAHPRLLGLADLVLECPGGRGAVRELAELVLGHVAEDRGALAAKEGGDGIGGCSVAGNERQGAAA